MAATVPVDTKGETNPLLDEALRIGQPADHDNEPGRASRIDPKTGSYEAFMSSFGSPARWGGR